METMIQCQMYVIDMGEKAGGPVYTLEHTKGRTYINNCLVTNGVSYVVSKVKVHEDEIQNVSDHLSITIDLTLNCEVSQIPVPSKRQVAWYRLTAKQIYPLYTPPLEEATRDLLVKHGAEQLLVADTNVSDVPVEKLYTFETDVVIREMCDKITKTTETCLILSSTKN